MSALEWKEPTVEELAEWLWVKCPWRDREWCQLSRSEQRRWIDLFDPDNEDNALKGYQPEVALFTLARAIEHERKIDQAMKTAEDALWSIDWECRGKAREMVAERDRILTLTEEARQRVNALAAKVLGKDVSNGS